MSSCTRASVAGTARKGGCGRSRRVGSRPLVSAVPAQLPALAPWNTLRAAWRGGKAGPVRSTGTEGSEKSMKRTLEELKGEIGMLDLDKVTETFGGNFGPQPDFHDRGKTVEDIKRELDGVVDLEGVGGVFDLPEGADVQLPLSQVTNEEADMELEVDPDDEEEEEDEEYLDILGKMAKEDPLRQASQEDMMRKGQLLLKLINSGKNFDEVLEENLDELDDVLLRMLDGRIAQAEKDKESSEIIDGLNFLFERLAMEKERQEAPEEMKLLDACLAIMIPEDVHEHLDITDEKERRIEAIQLLEEALAPPGVYALNVDPFELMSAIGPQQDLDIAALEGRNVLGRNVSRESFVDMVQSTIQEVEDTQKQEFLTLKKWSDEIQTSNHTEQEKALFKSQIQKMSKKLLAQRQVLAVTKEILGMAQDLKWTPV